MSFTREKIRDFYLLATDVENIFINEYMPAAPGDFVKVYLYGLLYSQNDAPMSYDQMARAAFHEPKKDRRGVGLLGFDGSSGEKP